MIILASSSPTRAKLLKQNNISFIQQGVNFDEDSLNYHEPQDFVYYATKGKLELFLKNNKSYNAVLCADSVVSCENQILRKAKDVKHAKQMLGLQSANHVKIITCMMYKSKNLSITDLSETIYEFMEFQNLDEYLKSNEWMGKAGAIMVEGFAKKFIKKQIGFTSTAMGLCVENLKAFLKEDG